MDRLENFKIQIAIILFGEVIIVALLFLVGWNLAAILLAIALAFNTLLLIWTMGRYEKDKKHRDIDISHVLGHDAKNALDFGKIGIIIYDEQYNATWTSSFLEQRQLDLVGKRLNSWNPSINELFTGDVDTVAFKDDVYIYEISRKEGAQVLFVKDVTQEREYKQKYQEERIVLGLMHLDNYMEISQYEDETNIALMNNVLRQPLVEWAKRFGMAVRRIRSDRYVLTLNEKIYNEILKDKFSILNLVRNNAMENNLSITLSLAFARGSSDLDVLDTMVNDLLELAQSRGGDQVAVKEYGQEVVYYGGNSQAQEKRSRVRVRVMSQAIKEALLEVERVFVVGHRNMDYDCMGSSLAMSRIAASVGKEVYIVSESGGIEPQLKETMNIYKDVLTTRHCFIAEDEALKLVRKDDLIIAVDFNNPTQCNAPKVLEAADKVIVIDHHRRSEAFINNPLLVYVESSASSASELISEFIPYSSSKLDICVEEATIMYLGILVDTTHFKLRTGTRTFEALASLRRLGVDPTEAEKMLKEDFEEFEARINVLKYSRKVFGDIMVAPVKDQVINRTIMSKAADYLINVKGIEAAFVIANCDETHVAVSARSNGKLNVQMIMEAMQGGGHFNAAALQRENSSVVEVCDELLANLKKVKEEEKEQENESNLIE